MENTISSLVKNYLLTKENIYFEELLDKFKPLITSYARKLYYLLKLPTPTWCAEP